MPHLRAVAFDMDGLIFNSEDVYTAVGSELLRRRGQVFSKELKDAMMGLTPQASFEVMIQWCDLTETWQKLAAESEDIFVELMDDRLSTMPGLLDLLDALEAAGIPKAIGTSTGRRLAEAVLSRFNLMPRFQFVLTADDVTHGKPHPEIYLLAAARLGVPTREMMVLEDSHYGCRAAAAAGTFVVAVPNHHTQNHDFGSAAFVATSLADPRIYRALGIELPPQSHPSGSPRKHC